MEMQLENSDAKWIRRIVILVIALIILHYFWDILLGIAVVVVGVLLAARYQVPINRFFSRCVETVRKF